MFDISELERFIHRFCELEEGSGSGKVVNQIKDVLLDDPELAAEQVWGIINNYIEENFEYCET